MAFLFLLGQSEVLSVNEKKSCGSLCFVYSARNGRQGLRHARIVLLEGTASPASGHLLKLCKDLFDSK